MSVLDPKRLHEVFEYDDRGLLIWKYRDGGSRGDAIFNSTYAGKVAGAPHQNGYLQVGFRIGGVSHKALVHRVIYAMHTGTWVDAVDHKDNDRLNNRISNLRPGCGSGNNRNRRAVKSSSGFKGVCFRAKQGRFHAQISVDNKPIHLGVFGCPRAAAAAYDRAAIQLFGDYARTNRSMGLL